MSDEKLNISVTTDPSVVPRDSCSITKMEKTEKVIIRQTANHNEVSIMESTWIQIKRKINLISFKKRIDISSILIGTMIPYAIDIINDYINKASPNYFPFFICCLLLVASKYIPCFSKDVASNNKVHLEDLKNYIEQVDDTFDASSHTPVRE